MDIAAWLAQLGLERYAGAFADNDIDASVLPKLTADDLLALGMSSVGHRRVLLEALAALNASSPPPPHKTKAERRQLTVLYCDLVESTQLMATLDPEEMRAVIRAYHDTCSRLIAEFRGYVANFFGDGAVAYFGWPTAREDDAERAVRTGLAMAAAVGAMTARPGQPLATRIGISTGQVVVGDLIHTGPAQESSAVGKTPNLAARLPALAAPGQVVVTEATLRLLGAGFEHKALGLHTLKGIQEPVAVFAVSGERDTEDRFEARSGPVLAPLVGRRAELSFLLERWERAQAGEGQGVLLVGEAGIGKSRLLRALLDAIAAGPHVRMRLQCSPHHSDSALWPVVQSFRHAAGFAKDDSPASRLSKLEAVLGRAGEAGAANAGRIAELVGFDTSAGCDLPETETETRTQRTRTLQVLVDHLLNLGTHQPALVLVEDTHWIDPTTLEMIEQALDSIASARALIVLTSRPDCPPRLPGDPHVTQLSLNRLVRSEVEAIVTRIAGDRIPPSVVDTIHSRADGVPLFIEELTKAVIENAEASVPVSLQDSLTARLDRLPEVKEVAQIASCIGREFDYRLLESIAEQPAVELQRALDKLVGAELVFRRGDRYRFKHALIQDAAGESMLQSKRQQVHARILGLLEADSDGSSPDILAHHAARARLDTKAIDYWQQAGEAAQRKSAYHEAAAHFSNAIERLEGQADSPHRREREFVLQVRLGQARGTGEGTSAMTAKRAYYRAHALSTAASDPALRAQMHVGMCMGHYTRGEYADVVRVGRELFDVAQADVDDAGRVWGRYEMGRALVAMGELAEGIVHLENVIAIHDPQRHGAFGVFGMPEPGGNAHAFLAWAITLQGGLRRAKSLWERAREIEAGQASGGPKAYLNFCCVWPAMVVRDMDAVRQHVERFESLARQHRLQLRQTYASLLRAMVLLETGQPADAVEFYRRGLAGLASAGARSNAPYFVCGLARAQGALGLADEARWAIQKAIVDTDQSMERWCEAELWRVRGDIFLIGERADPAEAVRSYERALTLARARGMRTWELRAATSLAKLRAEQDQRDAARHVLSPVYARFTEAFDTPDLRDAKALLDALA